MFQIQSPETLIHKLSKTIDEHIQSKNNILVVGIERGGLYIASELQKHVAQIQSIHSLNINFYRDDFQCVGLHPNVGASNLPTSIHNQHILLIDDVLYTGRTVRAAMNELFDYGRPRSIELFVLYERSGRELPIQAAWVGQHLDLPLEKNIQLYLDHNKLQAKII